MKDKIVICKAEAFHIDRIVEIEKNCFRVPWTKELLLGAVNQEDCIVLCAYYNGNMAGFCGLTNICGEGHITNIAVEDKYRCRGVGAALLGELLSRAKDAGMENLTLEVRVSNLAAIRLYEKHGFTSAGIRKRYYIDNNEDALIMWRHDPSINIRGQSV